jgi:hypothetical protein
LLTSTEPYVLRVVRRILIWNAVSWILAFSMAVTKFCRKTQARTEHCYLYPLWYYTRLCRFKCNIEARGTKSGKFKVQTYLWLFCRIPGHFTHFFSRRWSGRGVKLITYRYLEPGMRLNRTVPLCTTQGQGHCHLYAPLKSPKPTQRFDIIMKQKQCISFFSRLFQFQLHHYQLGKVSQYVRSLLFWGITQRRFVVIYRSFGTTCQSQTQGLISTLEGHRQVVPKRLAITTNVRCVNPRRANISFTPRRKPEIARQYRWHVWASVCHHPTHWLHFDAVLSQLLLQDVSCGRLQYGYRILHCVTSVMELLRRVTHAISNYDRTFSRKELRHKNWYNEPLYDRNVQWSTPLINSLARSSLVCHEHLCMIYATLIKRWMLSSAFAFRGLIL